MIESPETKLDQNTSLGLTTGPGRQLRRLREQQGLDIDRVASQLHLRPEILKALEEERYEDLPTPVFVSGYFKNYARLLDIDPAPIMRAYRQAVPASAAQSATVMPTSQIRRNSTGLWIRLLSVLLAVIALGVLYLWWQERGNDDARFAEDTSVQEATSEQSSDYADATPTPSSDVGGNVNITDSITGTSPSEPPAETVALNAPDAPVATPTTEVSEMPTESEPVQQAEPAPQEPAAPPEIVMSFTGTSWVDIRSADNSVVLNGEMRSGDRQKLSGEPPYKMVIGNAAATRITITGKPFDIAARTHGNVARFTLTSEDIGNVGNADD